MADPLEHYQMVLDDLMARRAKLDAAIAIIQEAMSTSSGAGTASGSAAVKGVSTEGLRTDSFFGMTVADAARKYLMISKRTKTAQEIADALKIGGYTFATGNPLGTVSSVLHRSDAKGGEIVRVSKGTWGLSEWYPGRGKRKSAEKNGNTTVQSAEAADAADAGDASIE